jgi:hypothetical protein
LLHHQLINRFINPLHYTASQLDGYKNFICSEKILHQVPENLVNLRKYKFFLNSWLKTCQDAPYSGMIYPYFVNNGMEKALSSPNITRSDYLVPQNK